MNEPDPLSVGNEEKGMTEIKEGDTVRVHFTGKLEDGTVFETTSDRDPLDFEIGADEVAPGFEEAVCAMKPGESKTVTVPADKAYGVHREDLVQVVERDKLPDDLEPEVGLALQISYDDRESMVVVITDVTNDKVTLDANHPLAGKDLIFEIEFLEIV